MRNDDSITYNLDKIDNPFHIRKAKDHLDLDALCKRSEQIQYKVVSKYGNGIPYEYLITYKLKGITGIDKNKNPIYGYEHQVKISLPEGYPRMDSYPKCYVQTDLWHPNIKFTGTRKGFIDYGGGFNRFDELVIRIGEMIQYKNYHASISPPYPEDAKVSKWVREYAEPNDLSLIHI